MGEEKGGGECDVLNPFTVANFIVANDDGSDLEGAYRGLLSCGQILLLGLNGHYFVHFCDHFV